MPTKIELGLVVGDCTEELRQFTELTNSAPPPWKFLPFVQFAYIFLLYTHGYALGSRR